MTTVHVRGVSDRAVQTLKDRASRSGQSLQAYVKQLLEAEAETLTLEEAAQEARSIRESSSVRASDVREVLAEIREERG